MTILGIGDGLPTLLNGVSGIVSPQPVTVDTAPLPATTDGNWGIYLDGAIALAVDSVVMFEYQREWTLSDYPLEKGAFETYNKVAKPFDTRLRVVKGGSVSDRQSFLDKLEEIAASLDLYDVITPEANYLSVNIEKLGMTRTADKGVSLLTVDIGLRQVRVTAVAAFSAVQAQAPTTDPQQQARQAGQQAAANPVHVGTVQPQAAPPAVVQKVEQAQEGQVFSDMVGPL